MARRSSQYLLGAGGVGWCAGTLCWRGSWFRAGQPCLDSAVDVPGDAYRLDPSLAAAHANLGALLQAAKRYGEAEAACREAIRLDPGLAAAHVNLGVVLRATQRQAEAEAEFREAIRVDPALAQAHSNLGTVLRESGQLADANAAFAEAVRLDPARVSLDTYLRVRRSAWLKSLRITRRPPT